MNVSRLDGGNKEKFVPAGGRRDGGALRAGGVLQKDYFLAGGWAGPISGLTKFVCAAR